MTPDDSFDQHSIVKNVSLCPHCRGTLSTGRRAADMSKSLPLLIPQGQRYGAWKKEEEIIVISLPGDRRPTADRPAGGEDEIRRLILLYCMRDVYFGAD